MIYLKIPMWKDHYFNGGTGITKISPERSSFFVKAVELWNSNSENIQLEFINGELHYKTRPDRHDISNFWELTRKLDYANN